MTGTTRITGIDTHAHIFRPDLPMVEGRRYSPEYSATLEAWFANQDAENISHGVLIQPSFFGTDNSHIEDALRAFPERLRAVAVVDPDVPEAELDRLDALGFVGARLNLVGKTLVDFSGPSWQRFFRRLAERRWQVEIQRQFDDLADIVPAITASGVMVMIDHFGLPKGGIDTANAAHNRFLDILGDTPSVYVKVSAPYRSAPSPDAAARSFGLLRTACHGIDRFVWGSDWPHTQHEAATSYGEQMSLLRAMVSDPAELDQILITNPAKIFRI